MLSIIHSVLHLLDSERAHNVVTFVVRIMNSAPKLFALLIRVPRARGNPVTFRGVTFPNAVGMAAGFDKQGYLALFLQALGFGFVEIGTVLPVEQRGNDRPRIFRFQSERTLINRMGFNSLGAHAVRANLARIARWLEIPIGISLGKMKGTDLAHAAQDYLQVLDLLFKYATYVAINVSSPNTPGLRELQGSAYLEQLVRAVHIRMRALSKGGFLPLLLVKIDPDMSDEDTLATVRAAITGGADGVIIANTSTAIKFRKEQEVGGVSGRMLFARAEAKVALVRAAFPDIFIVGVGGIDRPLRADAMIRAGANVIQLYTGFIFEGPPLIRACIHATNVARMVLQRG
jgi:dihydroorotate dehydrogenase